MLTFFAITSDHHSLRTLIGVQMIANCPSINHQYEKWAENCAAAFNYSRKILTSSSILLNIPVTTKGHVTYANMYCALCHDTRAFDFWDATGDLKVSPKYWYY